MNAADVLVVEDDLSIAASLMTALAEEGHRPKVATSGEAALEGTAARPFDIVLLDIGLPGIDGFETLSRLRAAGYRHPILMLTARDAEADRLRGLDGGADDYVVKPFALPELMARVRALLRLLRDAGRAVSKDELVRVLAGTDGELTQNAVEVYVSRLRPKIEPAGITIRTIRGLGYMMAGYSPE
ncbi:MAG: response regulator transcription factor [Betaproteobacteria bacterium]|nr:response regulator transcription factor [Betaproteobacteria bacterium]